MKQEKTEVSVYLFIARFFALLLRNACLCFGGSEQREDVCGFVLHNHMQKIICVPFGMNDTCTKGEKSFLHSLLVGGVGADMRNGTDVLLAKLLDHCRSCVSGCTDDQKAFVLIKTIASVLCLWIVWIAMNASFIGVWNTAIVYDGSDTMRLEFVW